MNVYNEIDPFAADWLESLIANGLIPPGRVERRSIAELDGADLADATQFHAFAGIAGWSEALRLAGVPDDFPIWSGSAPCQPYSSAGKGQGDADPRNLWPEMFRLVRECRPRLVVGEQVPSAIGHGWLDGVFADLEGEGYACGAVVLGAHSVGAPHRRQRLYWVADLQAGRRGQVAAVGGRGDGGSGTEGGERPVCGRAARPVADMHQSRADAFAASSGPRGATGERGAARPLGDAEHSEPGTGDAGVEGGSRLGRGGLADDGGLGVPEDPGPQGYAGHGDGGREPGRLASVASGLSSATGTWADCWLAHCRDGKSRRV